MENALVVSHGICQDGLFGKAVWIKHDICHSYWLSIVINNLAGQSLLGK
jgi:hypothetical protein